MKKENRKLAHHGCNVAEFLQTVSSPCLSVCDTRRGTKEGQEADKVLCFHPEWASANVRTSIVGLAQALTSFSTSFGADESAEHVMDAKHHRWVLVQCEPHIWLLMVAKKTWLGDTCSDLALRHFLRMVHAQHLLLQGPITCTLEQDPSGSMARRVLQPLMSEMGARLSCADSLEAAGLSNPLGQTSTHMPLLPTPTPAFLSVQCLVSALLQLLPHPQSALATHTPSKHPSILRVHGSSPPSKHMHPSSPLSSLQGSRTSASGWSGPQKRAAEASLPLQGAMVLWHGRPVWSTLTVQDGVAMYHFAQRALLPHVEGGKRCVKLLRSLAFTAAVDCQASASAVAAQEQEHAGLQHEQHNSATGAGAAAAGIDASQGGGSIPAAPSSFVPASSAPAPAAAKLPTRGRTGPHPPTICHACYDTLLSPNRWGVVEFLEACRVRSSSSSSSASTRNEEGGGGSSSARPTASGAPSPPPPQAQAPPAEQSGPMAGSYVKAGPTAAAPPPPQAQAQAPALQAGKEGAGEGAGGAEGGEAQTRSAPSRGSDPAEPKPTLPGSERAVISGSNGGGDSGGGGNGGGGGGNTGGDMGVANTSNSSIGGLNVGDGGLSIFKDMMANASAQASTALGSAATTFSALLGTAPPAQPMPSSASAAATPPGPAAPQATNPSQQQQQPNQQRHPPAQPAQQRLRQHPPQQHREHHLSGFLCPCPPPAGLRTHAVLSTGGAQAAALPPHALPLETAASVDDLGLRDGVASGVQGAAPPPVSVGMDGAEQQGGIMAARVWMQGMQRHCVLLPAFRGPLLVLMLLQTDHQSPPRAADRGSASMPNTVAVSPECLQAIVEVLAQHVPPTSGRLAAGVPAQDLWHCPGFRYCHEDGTCAATRCTPAEKVPTLSSSALKLTAYVRDKLQHLEHAARLQVGGGSEGAAQEVCDSALDELDFMCRTGQGSWITARHAAARQTLVTLEAHAPTSLAEAAAQVHKLYDTVARGFYAGLG
ncbi:hypothetical protein DUNSADRAFT_15385 [Dunaliella salina]|uniref:CCZ1/INTU/HSP4 first Longin domain-containing protein n=1 Tax=Dunaliella salina TaxID=3046 RepID=A0ABQ7H1W6_DUNSA|nr:hypothetical protein DUNSADRAFT_15385 [Dunaliella salina]|eukprot:KAF5840843.1 hypothetical protein DUNSADRAFT_15385 [Dunaliella salina]